MTRQKTEDTCKLSLLSPRIYMLKMVEGRKGDMENGLGFLPSDPCVRPFLPLRFSPLTRLDGWHGEGSKSMSAKVL